jgi:hypothetical protein
VAVLLGHVLVDEVPIVELLIAELALYSFPLVKALDVILNRTTLSSQHFPAEVADLLRSFTFLTRVFERRVLAEALFRLQRFPTDVTNVRWLLRTEIINNQSLTCKLLHSRCA